MRRPHGVTCCSVDSGSFLTFIEIILNLSHMYIYFDVIGDSKDLPTFCHITLINLLRVADMTNSKLFLT